jgi:hypothetical protein
MIAPLHTDAPGYTEEGRSVLLEISTQSVQYRARYAGRRAGLLSLCNSG